MSDLKAVLLGAIVGGAISMGATWLQGSMTKEIDFTAEKRQKMEALMEVVYKSHYCTVALVSSSLADEKRERGCVEGEFIYKLISLGTLYFPEMEKEIRDYVDSLTSVRLRVMDCRKAGVPKSFERKECLVAINKDYPDAKQIESLRAKAGEVFNTLR